jgi:formiminotetrahydrofolate cyclodeaminase/Zn-dependent peptidase ImmA (M78 family)
MDKLIELQTAELLRRFGSGKHKPGSGSAAALQALLAVQLIRTVIELSKSRERYRAWLPDFRRMEADLTNRIYPTLESLFQLDSEQFDRVIKLRNAHRQEKNSTRKRQLKQQLDDAVLPATQTPIAIAKLCAEIAGYAVFLCDNGFQSARGDSGVALNDTIATIAGCLSIIQLNLLSLGHNEETEQIRRDAAELKALHTQFTAEAAKRLATLEEEADQHKAYHQELQEIASGRWVGQRLSFLAIEQIARNLQNTIWRYREKLGLKPDDGDLSILNPQLVLTKMLDYQYEEPESLGKHLTEEGYFEVAGIINKPGKSVAVSRQFSKETRNFTAAHELGHALLHSQPVMHRDKPLDGSGAAARDATELAADKFATYFLMPAKPLSTLFQQLFGTLLFAIDENTVFGLTGGSLGPFLQTCRNLRELTRILAGAETYRGESFRSLAELFGVSKETMAIRLEELGLVNY